MYTLNFCIELNFLQFHQQLSLIKKLNSKGNRWLDDSLIFIFVLFLSRFIDYHWLSLVTSNQFKKNRFMKFPEHENSNRNESDFFTKGRKSSEKRKLLWKFPSLHNYFSKASRLELRHLHTDSEFSLSAFG